MKRKIFALCALVSMLAVSSCSVPFVERDSSSISLEQSTSSMEQLLPLAIIEKSDENMVAIRVNDVDGEMMFAEIMAYLQGKGEMCFVEKSGMIISINGKENSVDFSSCWMLYTSDAELANSEWGIYTYEGAELGSAIVGANVLPVLEGAVYVWVYVTF